MTAEAWITVTCGKDLGAIYLQIILLLLLVYLDPP